MGDSLPSVPQLEMGQGLAHKAGPPGGPGLAGMGGGMALGTGGVLGMPGEQQVSQLAQNSLRTASGELGAPLTYPASSLAQLQQMLQVTEKYTVVDSARAVFLFKLQVTNDTLHDMSGAAGAVCMVGRVRQGPDSGAELRALSAYHVSLLARLQQTLQM